MSSRVSVVSAVVLASWSGACANVSNPGHFEPRLSGERTSAERAPSPLGARATRWRHSGGDAEAASRFAQDFDAHLAAATLFSTLTSSAGALDLDGEVTCGVIASNGLAGSAAGGPHAILWAVLALVGMPTDWATARARLVLVARDAATGVALHTWDTGDVEDTAVAGLYYWPAPIEAALRQATEKLEVQIRASLPALEARVRVLDTWQAERLTRLEEALQSDDLALQARALVSIAALGPAGRRHTDAVLALATAADPGLRGHVLAALDALEVHDTHALATVVALERDTDPRLRDHATAVARRLRIRAVADGLSDPEVSRLVAGLADRHASSRTAALRGLERLGGRARPASTTIAHTLAQTTEVDEARAAVAALGAVGQLDDVVRKALEAWSSHPSEVGRAATIVLERLSAVAIEPAAAPPAPAATRPVVVVFELEGGELSARDRAELTGLLEAHLTATARFQIVPRGRILAELHQQKADSYRACFDTACQIEVGKAIAAEKVLSTKILGRSSGCVVSSTLYDLRSEATEQAAVVEGPCAADGLAVTLRAVAEQLRARP